MPEAILIFAVIFAACLFAIGAFLAACWYAIDRVPPPPAVLADANAVPYSPAIIAPLFAVGSYATDEPDTGTHETLTMPTFRAVICDGHDAKLSGSGL